MNTVVVLAAIILIASMIASHRIVKKELAERKEQRKTARPTGPLIEVSIEEARIVWEPTIPAEHSDAASNARPSNPLPPTPS